MFIEEFEKALSVLVRVAEEVYGRRLVSVAVFGSVGRGTPRPDSDIDVLLVADDMPHGRLRRMEEFGQVEDKVRAYLPKFKHITLDFSPVLKDKNEVREGSLLFLDMLDDARILFDKDDFLKDFFRRQKERLAELGAVKHYRKGAWYWVLKRDYQPGEEIEI